MKYLSLLFCTATLSVLTAAHAQEAPMTDGTKPVAAETDKPKKVDGPYRGSIIAVDPAANTFTTQKKDKTKTKVYTLLKDAKLTRDDQPITLADVKPGDYVRGICIKTGDLTFDVVSAKIGPMSAEEEAMQKKKDEEKKMKKEKAATP